MKYIHFDSAGILAGLATMLESFGHDVEDHQIALGMDAPWLLLKEDDHFIAGQRLYTLRWMNLYLRPRGFRLIETILPKEEIPVFLRDNFPAMLKICIDCDICHPVVCTGYENSRYHIINVKTACSSEPDQLSLSRPMLLRRLDDEVRVLTLEQISPESVDFTHLLARSLQTLADYEHALMHACGRTVTREDLKAIRTPLLRALMVDMLPMAKLLNQPILYEQLRLLHHDYCHIFTRNSPPTVELRERLPCSSIRKCIAWLMENVEDRLHDHGATDEQVMTIRSSIKHTC